MNRPFHRLIRIKPEPFTNGKTPQVGESVDYFVYVFLQPGHMRAAFVGRARVRLDGTHQLRIIDRPQLRRIVTALHTNAGLRGDL